MSCNNNNNENIIEVKVILLGDVSVGKTSLINICIGKKFDPLECSTISCCFAQKKIKIDSQVYNLCLCDMLNMKD